MSKSLGYIRKHASDVNKLILFVFSVVVLVLLFPAKGKFKYEYSRNSVWKHQDLVAPFDFAIQKSDSELSIEKQVVIDNQAYYFDYLNKETDSKLNLAKESFASYWENQYQDFDSSDFVKNQRFFIAKLSGLLVKGIYKGDRALEKLDMKTKCVLINSSNYAQAKTFSEIFSLNQANSFIDSIVKAAPLVIRKDAQKYLLKTNLIQNLRFNKGLTLTELNNQLSSISLSRGMIVKDELIISRGELVTEEKFQVLESLKSEYEGKLVASSTYIYVLLGQVLLVTISLTSFFLYLIFFRKEIVDDNKNLVLIFLVVVLIVALTSFVEGYNVDYIYVIPFCLIPIMIRAFFDIRLALFIQFMSVLILGFMVPNSFEFIFLQLIAGIVTIISIQNLQSRSQFFITSVWVLLIYSLSYISFLLIQDGSFQNIIWENFLHFAISASLLLFSYPLIYVFEKLFGRVTDVTLLELSNTNRRLLRQMASVAPGTFQHSLQVGNLAEEAIYEIGGNALLVRTGALYHDLGKMEEPLYYTENQSTGVNPHDELSFEESAQIIVGHVIKGIEKAKKNRLPEQIIDFIRTHHGTKKVEYFYIMKQKENPDEYVDPSMFAYPGPLPYSKETAVVMMADSVEAASRSIKFPDEQNIENLINSIINNQLEQGQFANANITLREISTVKKIFKEKLMNIYHVRISYPEK